MSQEYLHFFKSLKFKIYGPIVRQAVRHVCYVLRNHGMD